MQPGETDNDKKTVSFALFDSTGLPASGEVGEGTVAVFTTTQLQISYNYGSSYTTATGTFAHGGDGSYKYRFTDAEVQTSLGEVNIWLRYKTTSYRTMVLEVPLRYDTDRINTKLGTPAGASVSADIAAINTKIGTPVATVSTDIAAVKAETAVITTINTKIGTPVATVSTDLASVKSDTTGVSAINTKIGTPLSSVSADIAGIQTKLGTPSNPTISADIDEIQGIVNNTDNVVGGLGSILTQIIDDIGDVSASTDLLPAAVPKINDLHRIGVGRWKIQGTQLLIFDTDEESILMTFNLLDEEGEASATSIFERVPE